jgi:propanol-preferring alcohol dehydrogenase
MKAMLLKEFAPIAENPLELVDLPIPEPGPEDILIRNKICGVCHTDLHTVEGELPGVKLPIIPGHQVVGTVEKGGENTSRFLPAASVDIASEVMKISAPPPASQATM